MNNLVIQIDSALISASSLFLAAAGLTLIFGAMRVINLAHGSFYMFGAFLTTSIVGVVSGARFWWGVPLAALAVAVIGGAVEVSTIRRIYGREHLTQLLATFALLLIFADLALSIWGAEYRTVPLPESMYGGIEIAGQLVPRYHAVILGTAVAVGIGLWLLLRFTLLGWKIRAAVDDPESLEAAGVNLRALYTVVFALGALLAGLGGAVISPQVSVSPGLDLSIIVLAFIVTVIGGLGSVLGAAVGALLIGAAETIGTNVAPDMAATFPYLAMIAVLAVRPWGLFGVPER